MCGHVDMWSTILESQQIIIPQRRFMYNMYIPQCGLHINCIDKINCVDDVSFLLLLFDDYISFLLLLCVCVCVH